MSRLLDILGSKYPIIQGPIGELNDPKMVAAVSETSAFGMLALGFDTDLDKIKRMTTWATWARPGPPATSACPSRRGQVSALIDKIKPVKDIIEGLVS